MKRILSVIAVTFSVMLLSSLKNSSSAQAPYEDDISYQTFYDELDPYGNWVDYPEYGYVWVPDCGPDFRPYSTNGHWAWSDDYEWIWVSEYDWGWAPFHYGRWLQDSFYGWVWVPGYEWSPAWVAWRSGGDYYGWAPLRPGINISINFSIGSYNPPVDWWCFAPSRYITSHRIYDYYVAPRNNVTIINHTTIINNYNYSRNVFRTGPARRDVERYAGRINPVRLRESNSPGRTRFSNNEISVYRPRIRQNNDRNIAPRQFNRYEGNSQGNRSITRRNENINSGRNANNLPRRNEEITRNNETRARSYENRITRRNVLGQNNNGQSSNGQRPERIERPNNNNRSIERNDRSRQIETQNNRERSIERRNIFRNNNNQQNNTERQSRTFNRNNNERPMNNNRVERRKDIGRNEIRSNDRSQQRPSREFNTQRSQSPRFENRRHDNTNPQRGSGGNRERPSRNR